MIDYEVIEEKGEYSIKNAETEERYWIGGNGMSIDLLLYRAFLAGQKSRSGQIRRLLEDSND